MIAKKFLMEDDDVKKVKHAAIDRGFTMGQVADAIGMSPAKLSSILNGREFISDEEIVTLNKFCKNK